MQTLENLFHHYPNTTTRYRWAFVGSQYDSTVDAMNGNIDETQMSSSIFIPHVRRIARLMDLRFTNHSPVRMNLHFCIRKFINKMLLLFSEPKCRQRCVPLVDVSKYQQSTRFVRILFDVGCHLAAAQFRYGRT